MFSVREIANLKVKSGRLAAQSKYMFTGSTEKHNGNGLR